MNREAYVNGYIKSFCTSLNTVPACTLKHSICLYSLKTVSAYKLKRSVCCKFATLPITRAI